LLDIFVINVELYPANLLSKSVTSVPVAGSKFLAVNPPKRPLGKFLLSFECQTKCSSFQTGVAVRNQWVCCLFRCTIGQSSSDSGAFVDTSGIKIRQAERTQLSDQPPDDVLRCDEPPIQLDSEVPNVALSQNGRSVDLSISLDASNHPRFTSQHSTGPSTGKVLYLHKLAAR
jgi:hypothetical protein